MVSFLTTSGGGALAFSSVKNSFQPGGSSSSDYRSIMKSNTGTCVWLSSSEDCGVDSTTTTNNGIKSIRAALENMRALMEQAENDSSSDDDEDPSLMLLASIFPEKQATVAVAESSIVGAGMGLFAQRDIPGGTIIAFYPVHGMGMDLDLSSINDEEDEEFSVFIGLDPTDQQYFDLTSNDDYLQEYLVLGSRTLGTAGLAQVVSDVSFLIDINPNRMVHPPWISHFINDGATLEENSEQGIMEYNQRSQEAKNCVHAVPFGPSPIMASVTTRDVKEGEELFSSYGGSYWVQYLGDGTEEMVIVEEGIRKMAQDSKSEEFLRCLRSAQVRYAKEASALQIAFGSDFKT
jgi:hypothetical protein